MMPFADMTGLAGNALALAAATAWLARAVRVPLPYRAALSGAAFVAALIPFGSLSAAACLRGALGDLSVTTLVLLALSLGSRLAGKSPFDPAEYRAVQYLALLAALWLYPMALGLGYFDPYRSGYGDPWLLAVLLAVALATFHRRSRLAALAIALAVSAWAAGWYESPNLWDYLLDPLLALYAAGAFVRRVILLLLFDKVS